jgi:hypothetical protein
LHWGRWRRNGTTDTIIPTPLERFWSKVNKTETCWLWTGSLTSVGYGNFKGDGITYAHRFAYTTFVGPIPEGMFVDHKCHVRHCVNPAHLQVVTPGQNNENRRGAASNSKSGIRGVTFHKATGKWRATGAGQYGGLYDTPEEAELAAIALRNELMTNNLVDRTRPAGDAA